MKKALKIIGAVVLGLFVIILLGVAYINFSSLPKHEAEVPEITIRADSAQLARGEHLVNVSCALCHKGKNTNQLEGSPWREKDFGEVYTPNLTLHPDSKLSQYTDGELALMLRTGLKKDGEVAFFMPRYMHLSDPDLKTVIAYLRSDNTMTKPSDKQWPERKPNMLAKVLSRVAIVPDPYPASAVAMPDFNDPVAHGRYLAHNLACYHCHSGSFDGLNEMDPQASIGYFGGGNAILKKDESAKIISSNLTPHPDNGLGRYSPGQFAQAVRTGKRHNGSNLDHTMPLFTNLSDQEANALYAYLQTVPVIDNPIEPGATVEK
jgi:mono/diheme cytochrome c family protein